MTKNTLLELVRAALETEHPYIGRSRHGTHVLVMSPKLSVLIPNPDERNDAFVAYASRLHPRIQFFLFIAHTKRYDKTGVLTEADAQSALDYGTACGLIPDDDTDQLADEGIIDRAIKRVIAGD